MTTPRDQWIKIADVAKDITRPTNLDARPSRLVIRTRTWSGGTVGVGSYTDSDLVIPQKFKVRALTHDRLSGTDIAGTGGRYSIGDVQVSGITKRPSDDATVGYTQEQLAPTVAAQNVEVLYLIFGDSAGVYTRVDLNSEKLLSHILTLRLKSGNNIGGDFLARVVGDSEATLVV